MKTSPMPSKQFPDRFLSKLSQGTLLALALLVTSLASIGFSTSDAAAQGAVRSKHGDWEIRCDTPPGAPSEQCALMQYVTASDRDNVGLTVIVLKTADKSARILRVLTPLGVLLPHGLGLHVDSTDVGNAGFVRCLPQGCIAEVIMDDKLLKLLEDGQTATFIVFQTPEEGIGIPIELNGFKSGFEALN
nr:invasion associated locus B family protein [uncultured Cohaesibacter sp.]